MIHKKWKKGIDSISGSYDFLKKEILIDYISICKRYFPKITKKGNLMAYVSRSHDLPKSENREQVWVLTWSSHVTYQKRKFWWLTKHFWEAFSENYQKRKFDGWHKQVMWLTKKQKLQERLDAYLSRSCDLPKKEFLMAYISGHVIYSR